MDGEVREKEGEEIENEKEGTEKEEKKLKVKEERTIKLTKKDGGEGGVGTKEEEDKKFIREDLELLFGKRRTSIAASNRSKSPKKLPRNSSATPTPTSHSPLPVMETLSGGLEGGGGGGWGFSGSRSGSIVGGVGTGLVEEKKGKKGKKEKEKEKEKKRKKGKGGEGGEMLKRMAESEGKHREAMKQICDEICELSLSSSPSLPSISPSDSSSFAPCTGCSTSPCLCSSSVAPSFSSPPKGEEEEVVRAGIVSPKRLRRERLVVSPPCSPKSGGWREEKKKKKGWRNTLALRHGTKPLEHYSNMQQYMEESNNASPSRATTESNEEDKKEAGGEGNNEDDVSEGEGEEDEEEEIHEKGEEGEEEMVEEGEDEKVFILFFLSLYLCVIQ